ncbi:restriction endonuclease subunit S [Enterococcus sp.]|uniref:restriction endonuclease subunit S n=1 Tax=Enterococcus sp. TaxID=35783 RepID=UPI002FC630AF
MIDFNTFECVQLEDVAEFGRAKEGHIYPRGSSTIQISATNGQIDYLDFPRVVETKHVVIVPQAGINTKYFNYVLQKNVDVFVRKFKTGLNIQEHEVGKFPIELHSSETQKAIAKMLSYVDDEEARRQEEVDALIELKKTLLSQMMI